MPAMGQVDEEHYRKSELDVSSNAHYCPHEQALPIAGQVRTADNSALPQGVRLVLETEEGAFSAQQFVSADGMFRFDSVQGNSYPLVVTAKGFQTAHEEVGENWWAIDPCISNGLS
jgi:hypothetical protein